MTLYVARDRRRPERYDLGSTLCLRVLDLLSGDLEVLDAATVRPRPAWLTGTPTLRVPGGEVLRGHQALYELERRLAATASAPGRKPAPQAPRRDEAAEDQEEEEGGLAALWAAPTAEGNDDDEGEGERKITNDDLHRAMRTRGAV